MGCCVKPEQKNMNTTNFINDNNIENINNIIYPNISNINNIKENYLNNNNNNNNNEEIEKKNENISNITNFNSNNNILIMENAPMKIQLDSIRKKELENYISKIGEKITKSEFESLIPSTTKNYILNNPPQITNTHNLDTKNLIELDPIKFKSNNMIYEGEWNITTNKMEGKGKLLIISENVYCEGIWRDGKLYKAYIIIPKEGIYEGDIINSEFNGKGKMIYNNGIIYEGEFKKNVKDGEGILKFKDGSIYKGKFKNNIFEGFGYFKWFNGYEYNGIFKDNIFNGSGSLKNPFGSIYKGNFKNGLYHGKGIFEWLHKDEKYEGNYFFGKKNGEGKFWFKNGDIFKGNFFDGKVHGYGEYESKGNVIKCFWRNGEIVEKPLLIKKNDKNEININSINLNFGEKDEDIDYEKLKYINFDLMNNTLENIYKYDDVKYCENISLSSINKSSK